MHNMSHIQYNVLICGRKILRGYILAFFFSIWKKGLAHQNVWRNN